MEWHRGIKCTLKKDKRWDGDGDKYICHYYKGDKQGYHENDVTITVHDKAIYFSDESAEHFIYLYPEQVKHLKKLLRG